MSGVGRSSESAIENVTGDFLEAIADELETDLSIVEQICEVIKNAAPDSTQEDILGILMEKKIK